MKRSVAAVAVALSVGLIGCDERSEAAPEASPPPSAEAPPAAAPTEVAPAPAPATVSDAMTIDGAPVFAALYPGAQIDSPATLASGPTGPGGLGALAIEGDDSFGRGVGREGDQAAGLSPVMAMNQGEARAYGAAARKDKGASLQVVASPGESGLTSVQLSWSAGA